MARNLKTLIEHLYVHIPFCHRICPYCAFYKHTPKASDLRLFVEALICEARLAKQEYDFGLKTIYFGGGTPSMLSPNHLGKLFDGLQTEFDWSDVEEVSFEANPMTFSARRAGFYRSLGINRVSLGIQSFDEKMLNLLGREHSRAEAIQSYEWLREAGMPMVNIDLMFSIPGQKLTVWEESLATAISLKPDHISTYNLTYEEDTTFFEQLQKGGMNCDEDRDADFYLLAEKMLKDVKFSHYETSNFAQFGCESLHNKSYWLGENYLGLGPGAVSTVGNCRWNNVEDTEKYSEALSLGNLPERSIETLSEQDLRSERVALMLRMSEGLPMEFHLPRNDEELKFLCKEGFVFLQNGRIIPTSKGRMLVDELAIRLI